jgi:large subunit ribosomal protein L10
MPSNKILKAKKKMVEELTEEFKSAQTLIVADYLGLSVQQDTELRTAMRKEEVTYKVVKNTLAELAAKEAGYESLIPFFKGPTAIAYSKTDVVSPAKVLQKYADKIEVFSVKGGIMEGVEISIPDIKALASIPPKEVLYGQIVCGLISPIAGLAMILNAISEKGAEAGVETVGAVAVSA